MSQPSRALSRHVARDFGGGFQRVKQVGVFWPNIVHTRPYAFANLNSNQTSDASPCVLDHGEILSHDGRHNRRMQPPCDWCDYRVGG